MSRRSTRKATKKTYRESASYPDGPAQTDFEKMVAQLDKEAFNAVQYARVDAIITYALFSSKRRERSYRALTLEAASADYDKIVSKSDAIAIANECKSSINPVSPSRRECQTTALSLLTLFPHIFREVDIKIMTQ